MRFRLPVPYRTSMYGERYIYIGGAVRSGQYSSGYAEIPYSTGTALMYDESCSRYSSTYRARRLGLAASLLLNS